MEMSAIHRIPGDSLQIVVWDADGNRFGSMTITKDGVEWLPRKHQHPYSASWAEFTKWMEARSK